jgi:ATP-binding cassette subfamily B protein
VTLLDRDLRRALAYARPHWHRLVLVVGLSAAGTVFSLVLPYLSKSLVDGALLGGDRELLIRIVALFLAVTGVSFAINVVSGLRYTRVSADILFDMRLELYRHLQRLSPRFYARTPMGQILSRLNNDIGEIQRLGTQAVLAWVGNLLFLGGATAMLVVLDWRLFAVSLTCLPPALWALVRYRRRLEGATTVVRDRSADIGTFLIESLQGVKLVVTSNAEAREVRRFRERNASFVSAMLAMRRLDYLAGGLPGLLLGAGTAAVFLYGGWRVIGGTLTLGTFVAFTAYQMRLFGPVQGLMGLYAGVATARVSMRRVLEILDTPVEVCEPERPVALGGVKGSVAFERVSFTFDRGGAVLDDVSFTVRPGETVAIVGHSGSGKSTVADLLVRLLDPDAGRILLDGRDLRTLRLADVRRWIARVDQEPFILNASIGENIRYARPEASDGEVDASASAAGLEEFVSRLPQGLATPVGERGHALSAGERQRIAIARAFLADPAVLVLDEATGSLDPLTEAQVVTGYEAIMRGRTTILISHRLDLARKADRVIVLERGRLAEEGIPDDLLARRGTFAELFAASWEPVR